MHPNFVGVPLPAAFRLRVVAIAPGAELPYVEAQWEDSLVVVEAGEVEVECLRGGHRTFVCGDVIWLTGLPLRLLRNRGGEEVRLTAISRREQPSKSTREVP